MRLLLDTHAYLWMVLEPQKLSREATQAIADPANELFLSVASLWEAAIKVSIGKLSLPGGTIQAMFDELTAFGVQTVPVLPQHLLALERFPSHRGDPFDRMLVAQANVEGLRLVSKDEKIRMYEVDIFW